MNEVTLTIFPRVTVARGGARHVFDRDALLYALREPDEVPPEGKRGLALVCTATFRGDHRKNENVEFVHMLGLDFDQPSTDPNAQTLRISAALGGVEVFAYSTASSAPDAYKLRALVPYDRPAAPGEHRASWSLVARRLERLGLKLDRQCSDEARGFYIWAVPSNGVYFQTHVDGAPWPVGLAAEAESRRQDEIARWAPPPAIPSSSTSDKMKRASAYVAAVPGAVQGQNGSRHTFVLAAKLVHGFDLSDDEALLLLFAWNGSCQPPWSDADLRRKVHQAREKGREYVRGSMLGSSR